MIRRPENLGVHHIVNSNITRIFCLARYLIHCVKAVDRFSYQVILPDSFYLRFLLQTPLNPLAFGQLSVGDLL